MEMKMWLQAHYAQDNGAVRGRDGWRGDGRGKLALARRHPGKPQLKHPGHGRDRMVDENIQPIRVDGLVLDKALAQEPRHDTVIVAL
jgi:hypothetical protein